MNYKLVLTFGDPRIKDEVLVEFEREAWQRPVLNSLIEYRKKFYRVIASNPSSNPDNQNVIYTVKDENNERPYRKGQVLLKRGYNSGVENLNALD